MKKLIHNVATDEKTLVDLSAEEIAANLAQAEIDDAQQKSLIEAAKKLEIAKQTATAKLEALGLTTDDLKALGL